MNARLAFTELLAYYPHDNEVVSFVIDEYVATDKTEVFFTKVSRSPKAKVEFVKRDLGNQHMLLCHIQLFLHTLMVISHPDRFEDGQLKIAVEKVAKPLVENNETNNAVFAYCYRHEYLKQAAIHKETTEKKKYIIGNEELFSKIYHYLKETEVIDEGTSFQILLSAIENADISDIHPNTKDKFTSSLGKIQTCIKADKREWLREICGSIGITPKLASSNNTNHGEWYELLCDMVTKTIRK